MTVLHLPTLPTDFDEPIDPALASEQNTKPAGYKIFWPYTKPAGYEIFWPLVLAMAIRDGAASVHYHPWRSNAPCDDVLSYVVTGTRYGLVPPGDEAAVPLLEIAKQLSAPNLLARLRAWVAGNSVNRIKLVAHTGETEW